jgi:hypothetical protein
MGAGGLSPRASLPDPKTLWALPKNAGARVSLIYRSDNGQKPLYDDAYQTFRFFASKKPQHHLTEFSIPPAGVLGSEWAASVYAKETHRMSTPLTQSALEAQLETRYGLLLTQKQLAQFLGRSIAGLRWSLANPADQRTEALHNCARRVGRRVYYPASAVAEIIDSHCDR